MQICYVAGHSGGHIMPCVTQIQQHLILHPKLKVSFFSTNSELDKKILNKYKFIDCIYLPTTNIPKNKFLLPKFLIGLLFSFAKSFFYLLLNPPNKIVSMGGLVSIPVCFAAKILFIPIELYELNVEPGKTVNLLSHLTNDIKICFLATQRYFPTKKCTVVNYPVRFPEAIKNISQQEALDNINLNKDFKTILILGGSQGSLFLNNLIKNFVLESRDLKVQIIHQTGNLDNFDWQRFYEELQIPAITFEYYHEMEMYYLASDLIICRSGAGTLAEILFFNKKCITIPLETSYTSHQILNALELERNYPELIKVFKQNQIDTKLIKNLLN